jgi:hypothetical protein
METKSVLELYEELRAAFTSLEKDVKKNSEKHNCSAGVRVRLGLLAVEKACKEMRKAALASDKATKASRVEKRSSKKEEQPTPPTA